MASNIWEAAETGDLAAIQAYVDSGGDLDLVDVDGYQPLVLAAFGGQREAVRLLLDKKADVDVCGVDGSTALHLAAQNGDVAITQLLVERGADQTVLAQNATTALWLAVQEGFPECVKLLANPKTVNLRDASENHCLQLAISKKDLDVVALLLAVPGIDLEFKSSPTRMTALDQAVRLDNVPLARLVLQAGGKITVPHASRADDALLLWVLREQTSSSLLQFLVDEVKVDVRRPDGAGFSPLMIAVHNRDFEAVDILLPGSDVNVQAPDGSTCLLLATQNGDLAMSNSLLAAKASVEARARDGATALFLAAQEGFAKVRVALGTDDDGERGAAAAACLLIGWWVRAL
jgi:ankyrin repeat protein